RKRRAEEQQSLFIGVPLQAAPLLFGKFHALPVLVPRCILRAKFDAPRFVRRALSGCDVGLKLDGIGSGGGNRVDKRMGQPETSIVGLGHLADDQATRTSASIPFGLKKLFEIHVMKNDG